MNLFKKINNNKISSHKSGFTLVEISIVVVIIGLLAGGILAGKNLIAAAEIRSQISQIEESKQATDTFYTKYKSLPGDISPSKASDLGLFTFVGTYAGAFSTFDTFSYGNGDGKIEVPEWYVFWQHLSQAKLITGSFGGSATQEHLNNDSPAFPSSGGGIVDSSGTAIASPTKKQYDMFSPASKLNVSNVNVTANVMNGLISIKNTSLNNFFYFTATANQAYQIDFKVDDGKPLSGKVRERSSDISQSSNANCTKGAVATMTYDLTPATYDIQNACFSAFLW